MHPSDDIRSSKSNTLEHKRIVLCITGSVAAIRAADIARELMRLGADVIAVMSDAATRIIHPDAIHWATGNPVVTRLTGEIEHVKFAGHSPEKADLILVAPATANTIGKIASGIDDTPVTTFVTTALGEGIPCIIVPAMHESMYNHPIVKENIEKLKRIGIAFIDPVTLEGKAKIADTDSIVRYVESFLVAGKPLEGKSILVSAGPTIEFIDPVRIITNRSSGKMGIAICDEALSLGAKVTLVYGPGTEAPPVGARVIKVLTADQMHDAVVRELGVGSYDIMIATSAVSDFRVKNPSATKIPTSQAGTLTLDLVPTPKIIDAVKETDPNVFLVAFRAVTGLSDAEIVEDAFARLGKAKADLIVANDVSRKGAGFFTDTNEVFVIDKAKDVVHLPLGPKRKIAAGILEIVRLKMEKG